METRNIIPSTLRITLCILFASCFSIVHMIAQSVGSTYAESTKTKKAEFVYVYDGIPNFAELDGSQASGLVVDIMSDFAAFLKKKHGIVVTTKFLLKENFETFLSEVEGARGGVFGLSNISITEERKRKYSFSPAYLDNVSLLLSSSNIQTLSSLENIDEEFLGMKAYSLPSSSYLRRLTEIKTKYYPGMEISLVSSEAEILEKLENEENAFAVIDVNYYIEVLKSKRKIKRHSVGDYKDDRFGILMPKGSDWEPIIAEFFNSELIGTQRYNEIISKNLGSAALRLLKINLNK